MTIEQLESLEDRVKARNRTDALVRKRTVTVETDDFEALVRELRKRLRLAGAAHDRR
jgi:hypothetical protein